MQPSNKNSNLSSKSTVASRLKAFADSKPSAPSPGVDFAADYQLIGRQLTGLIDSEDDSIANMANCSALLWQELPTINWVGFYLYRDNQLVLGPFQGRPACTRIAMGAGVCGAAANLRKTIVVADVHQFPGHIACDAASNSEIVVPMIKNGQLIGLLDVDSPVTDRFDQADQQGLEHLVQLLLKKL
jgi:GAF domain-containing protein